MTDTPELPKLPDVLSAALRSGIAHNSGAGGQYLLCATESQLLAFAAAIAAAGASRAGSEPIPLGFRVSHNPDWSALTDEANAEFRWSVERIEAPFCGPDGLRIWKGPTLPAALSIACKAIGISAPIAPAAAAEPSERQPMGKQAKELERLARAWVYAAIRSVEQKAPNYVSDHEEECELAFRAAIIAIEPTDRAEDTKRLDYLQRRGATVDLIEFSNNGKAWKFRIGGLHRAVNEDIRAAIDAARASAGEAQS